MARWGRKRSHLPAAMPGSLDARDKGGVPVRMVLARHGAGRIIATILVPPTSINRRRPSATDEEGGPG
jgi:hypothetical protein